MAASTTILIIFSLLLTFSATLSSGCCGCGPTPKSPSPKSKPLPPPKAPPANPFCPRDTLKLGACVDLLGGIAGLVIGTPSSSKCCAVIKGLVDLEAAACLCTAIKANVLGIKLNVPVTLSLLLSACEKNVPPGFKCV